MGKFYGGNSEKMKIVTVYLSENAISYIQKLIEWGLTPSRSEYVRYAVYNAIKDDGFLIDKVNKVNKGELIDPDTVRIPNDDGSYSLKKIIRRLE